MQTSKKLWEVEHPYYCNEGNYFNNGCFSSFDTWQEFVGEEGDADLDMNLVFRFDWQLPHDEDDFDKRVLNPDPYYRDGKLLLFYMGQRKGLYRWVEVQVCQADEPDVRKWLEVRWEHMRLLWEPFSGAENKEES